MEWNGIVQLLGKREDFSSKSFPFDSISRRKAVNEKRDKKKKQITSGANDTSKE